MIALIVKILDIVEALLNHFVQVSLHFTEQADHEWNGTIISLVTPKGERLVGALATIIDNAMIMVAQLSVMFPLPSSLTYNTIDAGAGL